MTEKLKEIMQTHAPELYRRIDPDNNDPEYVSGYIHELKIEMAINDLGLSGYNLMIANLVFKLLSAIQDQVMDDSKKFMDLFGVKNLSEWIGNNPCKLYLIDNLMQHGFIEYQINYESCWASVRELGKDYIYLYANYPDSEYQYQEASYLYVHS